MPYLTVSHDVPDDRSDTFILDMDHIVGWGRTDDSIWFRVAPTDFVFRDVSDLEMAVNRGDSGAQIGPHEPSIDNIKLTLACSGPGAPNH